VPAGQEPAEVGGGEGEGGGGEVHQAGPPMTGMLRDRMKAVVEFM